MRLTEDDTLANVEDGVDRVVNVAEYDSRVARKQL